MPSEYTIALIWISTLNLPVLSCPRVSLGSVPPSLGAPSLSAGTRVSIPSLLPSNPLLRGCFTLGLSEHIKGVCFDCPQIDLCCHRDSPVLYTQQASEELVLWIPAQGGLECKLLFFIQPCVSLLKGTQSGQNVGQSRDKVTPMVLGHSTGKL